MKKLKILFLALLIANLFWGCEKDDICEDGTPTTPRMIIEFYDNNNPTIKLNVVNLAVVDESLTPADTLEFNGVSQIEIPLKTTDIITKYSFILNLDDPIPSLENKDKLEINYSRNDVFISRACGFKTVFTLNNPNGIVQETNIVDSNKWMKQITIQQHNILNEDEVHVKIFF
jgi:hypothetical protein